MRNVLCLVLMVAFSALVVGCSEEQETPTETETADKTGAETVEQPDVVAVADVAKPVELAAPPVEKFTLRVICGLEEDYKDPAGNIWRADKEFVKGSYGYDGGSIVTRDYVDKIAKTTLHKVYLTECYGLESYRISCPNGKYTVTLHFAETYHEEPGMRIFDVSLEGKKVLSDFDPTKEAGGPLTAVARKFDVEVTDGELTVGFTENTENPLINGIEVIQK